MTDHDHDESDVDRFVLDYIDSVPHLEALLLLWNSRPKRWSVEDMAKALFLAPQSTKEILDDLVRQRLIAPPSEGLESYCYESDANRDQIIGSVDAAYRRELVRLSRLIHSKPSAAVREFARAFRLKKDRE